MDISTPDASEFWSGDSPDELLLFLDNFNTVDDIQQVGSSSVITGRDAFLGETTTTFSENKDTSSREQSSMNTEHIAQIPVAPPPGGSVEGFYFNGPIGAPTLAPVTVSPFTVEIIEKCCQYSEWNKRWHVKVGPDGKMSISFKYNNIPVLAEGESLAIKLELRRINPNWQIPIDQVCPKHIEGGLVQHCIMPARGEERSGRYYNETVPGSHSVLYYNCDSLLGPDGSMSINIAFWFPCTQSCQNSTTYTILKEAARDSYLAIQLEKRTSDDIRTVLSESSLPVWLQAALKKSTFEQTERRKKKGAAAQLEAKKRKLEAEVKTELEEDVLKHIWLQQGRQLFLEGKVTQDEVMNIFQSPTA